MERREFLYRPHIKWFQYGLVVFLALGSVLPNAVTAVARATAGGDFLSPAASALFFGLMTLVMFWLFRTMASTRVIVDTEGIRYLNNTKDFRVPYSEIESLKFSSIPYVGGWLKIKSHHPDIRLTVVLEELDELVLLLKQGLDAAENQSAYQRKKLFRFYKTAGIAAHSWNRLYRHFFTLAVASLLFAVLGIAAMVFLFASSAQGPALGLLLAAIGLTVAPGFSYVIGEVMAMIEFVRGCDEEDFVIPAADESKALRYYTIGFGIYAGLITAVSTTLFLLG